MVSRLLLRIALVGSLALTTPLAQAQVFYSSGFEAPTYSTTAAPNLFIPSSLGGGSFTAVAGSLYNANFQGDAWAVDYSPTITTSAEFKAAVNASTVQTGVVGAGAQALRIDGSVANQEIFGAGKQILQPTQGLLDFQFMMRVDNPGTANVGQWGLSLYDTSGRNILGAGFYGGFLVAGSGPSVAYTPLTGYVAPVNYSTWNTYKVQVNFSANTMSLALNGISLSGFQNLPLRSDVTFAPLIYSFDLGGQTPVGAGYGATPEVAYFDNVTAAHTAPEPGTLALLTLGGTLVVVSRRRRLSFS